MNEFRTDTGRIDATKLTMEDVVDIINIFKPHIDVFMGTRKDVMAHIEKVDGRFSDACPSHMEGPVNYQLSCELNAEEPANLNGPTIQLNLECVNWGHE